MKTHTIKTRTTELMVVELPENIESDYSLIYGTAPEETYLSFRKNAGFKPPRKSEKLENGIWMVLGKPDEISEEEAEKLVESWESVAKDGTKVFENYLTDIPKKRTAKESLLSLIESEIYWVNPIELEKWDNDFGMSGNVITYEWKVAEQKTFDINRSLIFVKNKQ